MKDHEIVLSVANALGVRVVLTELEPSFDVVNKNIIDDDTLRMALNKSFYDVNNTNENLTIKDFLKNLLLTIWEEEESFSGKRPFGNSGWKYNIYNALAEGGLVEWDSALHRVVDETVCENLILRMIKLL